MKKLMLLCGLMIWQLTIMAQTFYQPGYYITEEGTLIEGLIRNQDWRNNPDQFRFKSSDSSPVQSLTIEQVIEMGTGGIKFRRFTTNIDRASDQVDDLDRFQNPEFKEETLLLKVIIEGPATLYQYVHGNLKRYFFLVEGQQIQQLVYKRFINSDGNVGSNNTFRHQLFSNLKCGALSVLDVKDLDYEETSLTKFILDYNSCIDPQYVNLSAPKRQGNLNLYLRPGINFSSLEISNSRSLDLDTSFGRQIGFRLGVELEFVLPFNNGKWAILLEPTFQSYRAEEQLSDFFNQDVVVSYQSIQFPVGFRYFFFVNDDSKIFLNLGYLLDYDLDASIDYSVRADVEIQSVAHFFGGVGFNLQNKYSVELRYGLEREILNDFIFWNGDYQPIGIYFGYNLKTKK